MGLHAHYVIDDVIITMYMYTHICIHKSLNVFSIYVRKINTFLDFEC